MNDLHPLQHEPLMRVPRAARVLGVTRQRAWQLCAEGELQTIMVGDIAFLRCADVERLRAARAKARARAAAKSA